MNKDREVPLRIIIRKKRHAHAHHGGAWKVAFADFMTAMFALFLVLWLVNQSSDVRSAIAGYFQDPLGQPGETGSSLMPSEGPDATGLRAMLQQPVDLRRMQLQELGSRLLERMEEVPEFASLSQNIEIELIHDGLRIQLLEDSTGVFFATGSSQPRPEGQRLLALLGLELGSLPYQVVIEGFTDARRYTGNASYTNWELSADRANAARRILLASGLRESQISQIRGWADRDLRVPDDPYSPRNRRVTITMLDLAPGETSPGQGNTTSGNGARP
jgi:chemotaxis protein MotB